MLHEDEVAKSRSDLQTHNDRLTDTQHEQLCKQLRLSTVIRELGLSHDVETWKGRIS